MKAFGTFFLLMMVAATAAILVFSPVGKKIIELGTALAKSESPALIKLPEAKEPSGEVNPDFAATVNGVTGQPATAPEVSTSSAPETDVAMISAVEAEPAVTRAPVAATLAKSGPVPPSTIEELARQPKLWPLHVFLAKGCTFPVTIDGRVLGSADVPAGTRVKLIAVQPDRTLTVDFNGGRVVIPAADTDLAQQLKPAGGKGEPLILSAQVGE